MPLTQIQIIQSLGEALSWFEKELEWGVAPGELNHLTGRIGELYAAMITRGQMATTTNQRGYDVVSAEGERISVKTVTTSVQARFNTNTLELADRIMVLRINVDDDEGVSVETLLDIGRADFDGHLRRLSNGSIDFPIASRRKSTRPLDAQSIEAAESFGGYTVQQFESGSIGVLRHGNRVDVAKPVLRELAAQLGVDLLNGSGRPRNTRQLGAAIIKAIGSRHQ
ncbi:DUF6998 domain-containing protein [Sphingosinithalassobacter sp. CS137]|uniref:DUF6998 domain-containing protein n=1 Tax=Sphingosinithalassobacter sp. CS137 TaxID=2762748 RepID=UPI00165E679D|nr:hypothetical protein [Sphingosinithalassobacter sp. CS137]